MSYDPSRLRKTQLMAKLTAALNAPGRVTPDLLRDAFFTVFNEGVVNAQTGTAYTLEFDDLYKMVTMSNASANTLTVPPEIDAPFQDGDVIDVVQLGAGTTTIAAGEGVTLRSLNDALAIGGQYSAATVVKIGTNEWLVVGSLA